MITTATRAYTYYIYIYIYTHNMSLYHCNTHTVTHTLSHQTNYKKTRFPSFISPCLLLYFLPFSFLTIFTPTPPPHPYYSYIYTHTKLTQSQHPTTYTQTQNSHKLKTHTMSTSLIKILIVLISPCFCLAITNYNPNTHKPSSHNKSVSLSFSLKSLPLSPLSTFRTSLISSTNKHKASINSFTSYAVRSSFKYSMALIVSLPIGTPPQTQQMVLDTGSQLSWIQCHKKPTPTTSFDPSRSSSFSILPCNHPICKPSIPDYTLPTSCDQNRHCHYSYFYADGTYAEGNLVREKLTFSVSQSTPPLILGCAAESAEAQGILGMNMGRFSFPLQAKLGKFSYCVPPRAKTSPTGAFYLGENPNAKTFAYVSILTFPQSQRMPNLDPLAYTLPMVGIRIGGKKLNIPATVFRPNPGGAGQTMIDSGTEYTFLVDEAYGKLREEVVRLVGPKMRKGYVYENTLEMCFNGGDAAEIGRLLGDMVFEFEKGVEIAIQKERVLDDVGGGVHCFGIGRSASLGVPSNIIGNFHQQNLWVEFDVRNRRVGFGKADCSRSV